MKLQLHVNSYIRVPSVLINRPQAWHVQPLSVTLDNNNVQWDDINNPDTHSLPKTKLPMKTSNVTKKMLKIPCDFKFCPPIELKEHVCQERSL